MSERGYVEDTVDDDGYIVPGYTWWTCDCGNEIRRYRGTGDVTCHDCGQEYNAFGQRLRSDWRSNRSNWDEDVSDMDGFEESQGDW